MWLDSCLDQSFMLFNVTAAHIIDIFLLLIGIYGCRCNDTDTPLLHFIQMLQLFVEWKKRPKQYPERHTHNCAILSTGNCSTLIHITCIINDKVHSSYVVILVRCAVIETHLLLVVQLELLKHRQLAESMMVTSNLTIWKHSTNCDHPIFIVSFVRTRHCQRAKRLNWTLLICLLKCFRYQIDWSNFKFDWFT